MSIVDNSVDPGQLASKKSADLDLHCFSNTKTVRVITCN